MANFRALSHSAARNPIAISRCVEKQTDPVPEIHAALGVSGEEEFGPAPRGYKWVWNYQPPSESAPQDDDKEDY
jgi:hypothetical protein